MKINIELKTGHKKKNTVTVRQHQNEVTCVHNKKCLYYVQDNIFFNKALYEI